MLRSVMTLDEQFYKGNRAREVLDNDEFQAAFTAIETEIIEQWKQAPARDAEGREKLWAYLHLMNKFKACLTTTLETGKLASLEIQHQRKLTERLKDGWGSLTA